MALEDTLNELPDCVLLQIFKHCKSKRELWRARSVCKRWYILLSDSELWRVCDLSDFKLDDNNLFNNFVDYIPVKCLQYLEISRKVIRPNIIKSLLNTATKLQGLTLSECKLQSSNADKVDTIQNDVATESTVPSKEMVFLDMRTTTGNLKVFEDLIIENGCRTKVLGVSNSFYNLNSINGKSFLHYFPNLMILELFDCNWVNDETVRQIGIYCPNIQALDLTKCLNIRGTNIGFLLRRCRKLRTLILHRTNIRDEEMERVKWSDSKLTELDISNCYHLDETALNQIVKALAPQLTYLRCAFTNELLNEFINLDCPIVLRELELRRRDPLSLSLLSQFLSKCKQLVALDFSSIPVEYETLQSVLPRLPLLKWLYYHGNEAMKTIEILDLLTINCKHIESVGINYYQSSCDNELSLSLHRFISDNKKLRNLHLEGVKMSDAYNQLQNMKAGECGQHHRKKTNVSLNKMKNFHLPPPELSVDNTVRSMKHSKKESFKL